MTEVEVERVKDEKNADNVLFKLNDVLQMISGPVENGRLTSSKRVFGTDNFADAVKELKWN